MKPWHERVIKALSGPVPQILYHATTPRKLARYKTTGEYIDAYNADPMTHCETCRKKAVWYDREKERFLAEEMERLAAEVSAEV